MAFEQRADAVDMADDHVTTEWLGRRQRAFEIDATTNVPIAGRRQVQRLGRQIGGEAVVAEFDRRQADAIDRNAVADLRTGEQARCTKHHAAVAAARVGADDGAYCPVDAGEHTGLLATLRFKGGATTAPTRAPAAQL